MNYKNKLAKQAENYLLRQRHIIEPSGIFAVLNGKLVINFSSNDYLNLSLHPKIKKIFSRSAAIHGFGSGSSALIAGYSKSHFELEEAFASYLNRDRALLFNSGYHANLGVLTALADANSVIIADKFCHASLIDGLVLSRAAYKRYRHNDISHAATLLE